MEVPEPLVEQAPSTRGCVFCDGRWPHHEPLYEDDVWSLRRLDGPPGWAVLWLRRHVESLTELTGEELASLGPVVARVTAAIEEAAGAERVYVSIYGESIPHVHVVLTGRDPDVPAELRGPAMLPNVAQLPRDDARAGDVALRVRELLCGEGT